MTKNQKPNFFRDTNGNLSIITGVVGLMLMTAVGASLDGGRMFSTKQNLQSITDAAALMAATPEGISVAERKRLAQTSIASHVERTGELDISATTIEVNDADGQVYVELSAKVPLIFGGVLGDNLRHVSASSLAEESMSSSMNPLSVSLVLDLSDSMGDRFDNGSKLASVNAAVSDVFSAINANFGGDVAAATNISTGVYPFNWGMVDGETVALEPGTNTVLDSLSYLSLSNGSVPTTAMERAVQDQIDEMATRGTRDRYIVYVTDGKVDEDRADVAGQYLSQREMFEVDDDQACLTIVQELNAHDELVAPNLVEAPGAGSPFNNVVPDVALPNTGKGSMKGTLLKDVRDLLVRVNNAGGNGIGLALGLNAGGGGGGLGVGLNVGGDEEKRGRRSAEGKKRSNDRHAGHNHDQQEDVDTAERVDMGDDFISLCQPVQPLRVAEACEMARDNGINIIAVNLSGEDGVASNATDMCVNGVQRVDDDPKKSKKKVTMPPDTREGAGRTRTLPSGIQIRVSADGNSYAGDANNLDELRDMLSSMLPDGKKERHVRLVG